MNAKNPTVFSFLTILLTCVLVLSAYAQTGTPGSTVEVTIFVDVDSLTVYVPSGEPEFLGELGFLYHTDEGNQTRFLSDYFGNIGTAPLETPICFRLQRGDSAAPLPIACPEMNTYEHAIHDADVFWYSEITANYRLFVVVQGLAAEPIAGELCPSSLFSCSFVYPFFVMTPISDLPNEIPPGYSMFDSFDGSVFGGWEITNDSVRCTRILLDGSLQIECFGSDTEEVGFTMLPAFDNERAVNGVAMGFYTLPVQANSTQWGKYQFQVRFGSDCDLPVRAYNISIRSNRLNFVEMDGQFNALNSPSPEVQINPGDLQVIRIENQDGQVNFYHNDNLITTVTAPADTRWVCWMFQSDHNNRLTPNGYRGMVVQWIAIK